MAHILNQDVREHKGVERAAGKMSTNANVCAANERKFTLFLLLFERRAPTLSAWKIHEWKAGLARSSSTSKGSHGNLHIARQIPRGLSQLTVYRLRRQTLV